MQKINNPYDPKLSSCFGCSESNPIGLKLHFFEDGEEFKAEWEPTSQYAGFVNLLHGGISATLLDEIGAWCVSVQCGTACVTSELNVKYGRPVYISRGKITVTSTIINDSEKTTSVECKLFDGEGNLCVTADAQYFKYPEKIARQKFFYPGKEAFYMNSKR